MTDRIEPIKRRRGLAPIVPVLAPARREERDPDAERPAPRRPPQPAPAPPAAVRDGRVDIRA